MISIVVFVAILFSCRLHKESFSWTENGIYIYFDISGVKDADEKIEKVLETYKDRFPEDKFHFERINRTNYLFLDLKKAGLQRIEE